MSSLGNSMYLPIESEGKQCESSGSAHIECTKIEGKQSHFRAVKKIKEDIILSNSSEIPYARHYKSRLVYFLPHFQRPFLCF